MRFADAFCKPNDSSVLPNHPETGGRFNSRRLHHFKALHSNELGAFFVFWGRFFDRFLTTSDPIDGALSESARFFQG